MQTLTTPTAKSQTFAENPIINFLLHCISVDTDEQVLKRTKTLEIAKIDWQTLIQLATEHRVIPLLYRRLNTAYSDIVPNTLLTELRQQCHKISIHNLFVTAELSRLLDIMAEQGIDAMPYKGPVLAQMLYEDLSLRQFGDLDIVIQPQDMQKVESLLIEEGYYPYFGKKTATELADYMAARNEHSYDFYHDQKKIFIEMHWRFWPVFFSSVNPKDIWHRREQVTLAGQNLSHTKIEDCLVILCMHGSRHQWERLSWMCDIAMLIEKYPDLDWEDAITTAKQWGAKRMLYLGLYLAHTWLGATLPASTLQRVLSEPAVPGLAIQVGDQLFKDEDSQHFLATTRYQIQARERWQDKAVCAQAFVHWLLQGCPSKHQKV